MPSSVIVRIYSKISVCGCFSFANNLDRWHLLKDPRYAIFCHIAAGNVPKPDQDCTLKIGMTRSDPHVVRHICCRHWKKDSRTI